MARIKCSTSVLREIKKDDDGERDEVIAASDALLMVARLYR